MSIFYFGSALNLSSIYMTAGAGAAISIKSGKLNLGGEGQIYAGGFLCTILLNSLAKTNFPSFLSLFFALSAAFCFSGILSLFCAFLEHYKKADFLFTSYIVSVAIIPFIDGLISGPFRSSSDNLLATPFIPEKFRFHRILPPSSLNFSFIFSILFLIFFFFLIFRTTYGRKLCILGISSDFADFSCYNIKLLSYSSSFISGGLHGLAGAFAVCGTYYTCHCGFYAGMGWNAFSSSLIADANPLLLIISSIFMGFLTTYSNKFAIYHNFGFDMTNLLQGIIILAISFVHLKTKKRGFYDN